MAYVSAVAWPPLWQDSVSFNIPPRAKLLGTNSEICAKLWKPSDREWFRKDICELVFTGEKRNHKRLGGDSATHKVVIYDNMFGASVLEQVWCEICGTKVVALENRRERDKNTQVTKEGLNPEQFKRSIGNCLILCFDAWASTASESSKKWGLD